MLNVFMLLTDDDGEPQEINLGSLYVDRDATGFIRDITIEPYDFTDLAEWEVHFDSFDPEVPEVPWSVQLGSDVAGIYGFYNDERWEVDLELLREDPGAAYPGHDIEHYELIVRSANRLYERAVRGEPAFVGYTDPKRHRQLRITDILKVTSPLPPSERRKGRLRFPPTEAAEQGRTLRRVSLWAENEAAEDFPRGLELDVCTRPDGFPHRLGRVLGLADDKRPLVIADNGDLRIGDAEGFYTNLMACKMEEGEFVGIWADHCQRTHNFRIEHVQELVRVSRLPSFS
jgi:hypothetical protein